MVKKIFRQGVNLSKQSREVIDNIKVCDLSKSARIKEEGIGIGGCSNRKESH